ncbi:pyridoxamine 5-phosphate oxidase [Vibrio sp. 10N.286.49.B3]|uniref:DUF3283 family protein n=1 Tax=Vibrio sp. 10N.286.49.B3 TaxID=1880855 RepID=UPI000C85A413|nr:DUF3283 family protein [Vibrio sp. 10N.286.49.B3]PMH43099.1 pyridoxamine 5-phosphate oxidase [Vibrio sp. 10N.286.49.B3]
MSVNLSLLPSDEKNRIELDKQASFLVWKLKHAKSGPEAIVEQSRKIVDEQQKEWFQQSIEKYKRVMGVA